VSAFRADGEIGIAWTQPKLQKDFLDIANIFISKPETCTEVPSSSILMGIHERSKQDFALMFGICVFGRGLWSTSEKSNPFEAVSGQREVRDPSCEYLSKLFLLQIVAVHPVNMISPRSVPKSFSDRLLRHNDFL
jgi:hypothetical protein